MKKSLSYLMVVVLIPILISSSSCSKSVDERNTTTTNPTVTVTVTQPATSSQTTITITSDSPVIMKPVFYVYLDDGSDSNHYIPSGWMGDSSDITFEKKCIVNPHSELTCIKIIYKPQGPKRWAGVYWQDPENNWGEKAGGFNLTNFTKLVFWARGEAGGEKAEFKVGGLGRDSETGKPDKPYYDSITAVSTGVRKLKNDWQQYIIDLTGKDLSLIIGGFVWVTNKDDNPEGCTIYLDDIRFE
jgi:hypothetical protein